MKPINKKARIALCIAFGVMGGLLSLWLVHETPGRKFEALKRDALCVIDLAAGVPTASVTVTNTQPLEMFHVGLRTTAPEGRLSITIHGSQGQLASASGLRASYFGLGRSVPPGLYTVTLKQDLTGMGGSVVIASTPPVFTTGWQLWSRTYVGLLALASIWVVLLRKAPPSRTRAFSITVFHSLLLGAVLVFVYLLFHESGHAIPQLAFGHFDLSRSDFWGIHGHPHSGGRMGPPLQPWQQTLISCAGPMLPTLMGFLLFLTWTLPAGKKLRNTRPIANLYFSAIVGMLIFPEAVCGPAYLLGWISAEGDLVGTVTRAGGPTWLVRSLLAAIALFSAFILWRVVPEIIKAWRATFLEPWNSALRTNQKLETTIEASAK